MQINKISSFNFLSKPQQQKTILQKQNQPMNIQLSINPLDFSYNDYLLSFGARVDKGLPRFYEENKERMPLTLREYVDSLENKREISPLEANYEAFSKIKNAKTPDDIKNAYPDEPLFKDIIPAAQTKATRGLLYDIRVMENDLKESNEGVLAYDKDEDLSAYLIKKMILESKTLEETNEALDKDINPIFKREDKNYLNYSTLQRLGIQLPEQSYRQSLIFTREGHSDKIGEKISEAQKEFYSNLTPEQRIERAKKSIQNIENWWNGLSDEQKKEILINEDEKLAFLKAYQGDKSKLRNKKPSEKTKQEQTPFEKKEKLHTPLKDDSMFLEFASKQLEIYRASLSDEEIAAINEKRSQKMIERWSSMTPEQKTDYISKMQAGNEKQKFAMIDAWNNSLDVREHLSAFLKEKHIHKPETIIYKTNEYSEYQSKIMKEFWQNHPQDAQKIGEAIKDSNQKIKKAQENDTFDELKEEIIIKQTRIKKEMKSSKQKDAKNVEADESPLFKKLEKEYRTQYSFLPEDFLKKYLNKIKQLSKENQQYWLEGISGIRHPQKETDRFNIQTKGMDKDIMPEKRAVMMAMADKLYDATEDPTVYKMKYSDLTVLISSYQHSKSKEVTTLTFNLNNKQICFKYPLNVSNLDSSYQKYLKPLSDKKTDTILKKYYPFEQEDSKRINPKIREFLKSYGGSLRILLDKRVDNKVKNVVLNNCYNEMDENLQQEMQKALEKHSDESAMNELIKKMTQNPNVKLLGPNGFKS